MMEEIMKSGVMGKILKNIPDFILAIVAGIVSSLLTTCAIEKHNKKKAKNILLKNFRFMEAMEESHLFAREFLESAKPILKYYSGVKWFHFPGNDLAKKRRDILGDKRLQKEIYSFYKNESMIIQEFIDVINSEKNDAIYDTIDKSLSVYYDEKLCNIMSDLRSRSHDFNENGLKINIKNSPIEKMSIVNLYYTIFHILAYISYLFDLYAYLGIENKMNKKYEITKKALSERYEKNQ